MCPNPIDDSTIFKLTSSDDKQASAMPKDLNIYLHLLGELGKGRSFRLMKNPTVIGRGADVDLRLLDDCISRRHAKIEFRDHKFHISDMNSTNGTFVNEAKVFEAGIKHGDIIGLGDVKFKFTIKDEEPDDIKKMLVGVREFMK
jgi:pSer/pThr/pTyr-binding forkhead associated (FHA) protein